MEEDRIVDIKRKNQNLLDRIAFQMVNDDYRNTRKTRTVTLINRLF